MTDTITVYLNDGPVDGQTRDVFPLPDSGRPPYQLAVAPTGDTGDGIANYWRRVDLDADGRWYYDFREGTRLPEDFPKGVE